MTIPLLFFINTLLKVESAAADFISSLSTRSFTPSSLSPATSKFTESFFSTSIYNLRVIKSNNFVAVDLLCIFKHPTGFNIPF